MAKLAQEWKRAGFVSRSENHEKCQCYRSNQSDARKLARDIATKLGCGQDFVEEQYIKRSEKAALNTIVGIQRQIDGRHRNLRDVSFTPRVLRQMVPWYARAFREGERIQREDAARRAALAAARRAKKVKEDA